MKKMTDFVFDREGNAVVGAEVYVRDQGDNTLVDLFSDDGVTPAANPCVTDNDGEFSFYTADNTLKLQVYVGAVQQNEINQVQHFDLDDISAFIWTLLNDVDAPAAQTTLGLLIGTNVQAYDAQLTSLASLAYAGNGTKAVAVNAAETGFELVTVGGSGLLDANWFNVKDYGALGDNSTDDTVAIQAAIAACEAYGGGTVYFPKGIYIVGGALQDTGRSNAQLLLPLRDYVDTEAITVVLRGEAPPPPVFSVIGTTPLADNLSVIKGTLNTASGTAPCMIGAHGPVGTAGSFTNLYLVMRDLVVQMPVDPALTALDLSCVAQADLDNVLIHAGNFDVSTIAAQSTAASYGIKVPDLNNGALTRLGIVNVVGFYNGCSVAEHTVGVDVTAAACKQGFVFVLAYHASAFTRLQTVHCQKGLVFTGGVHATEIQQYNVEHAASGTWVNTYDVDDASNYARGSLRWRTVLAGTGAVDTFNVNGNIYFQRLHVARQANTFALTDAATVTVDCSLACSFRWYITANRTFANPTAPYDTQVINIRIVQDATGSRTWTLGSKFKFAGGAPVLSTGANAKDFVSCQYDANEDSWNCAISKGMA